MITVRATRTCCALVIAAAGLAAAAAPTFELFRGLLTWHVVSGRAGIRTPLQTTELSPAPASPPRA
jgi:hypothetical protein